MAIPFKSPISIDTIVPSSMEPTTKLTLGAYSIKLQSGTNTSIAINGSSSGSLTLTSPNINITDNDHIVLQHYNNANIFGNHTIPTYLEGYPFYISGLGIENDVLIFNENGITLSNNTKNTNIKGSNIVIDGSKLTVPADTKLNSIVRKLEPTSIACINDLGFEITPYENTI